MESYIEALTELVKAEDTDRSLETKVTRIAVDSDIADIEAYSSILKDEKNDYRVRFASYLITITYHRRRKDAKLCHRLAKENHHLFKSEFLYLHTYSIVLKLSELKIDIAKSVTLAEKTVQMQPNNCGALHNLAGSLFMYAECDGVLEEKRTEKLERAQRFVYEALALEPGYPKFYGTQAKILAALGEFNEAINSLLVAIDLEDSTSKDYNIRLTDYLNIRMRIDLLQTKDHLKKNIKREIEKAAAEARKNNLEILSFFVAIISFTIGGISILQNFNIAEAIQLIFVLSSCLLIVISGATLVFDGDNKFKRFVYSILFASLLLALAYLFPYILKV